MDGLEAEHQSSREGRKDPPPTAPKHGTPVAPPDGDFFAGMDVAGFPGDRVMQSLIKNTNLKWTGFYLTPTPSQGHNLKWMDKHGFLRGLGWGIAPIYVGRQVKSVPHTDHRITPENGKIDGEHAAHLAGSAKIGHGSVIYLDFENGAPLEEVQKTYYAAWASAVSKKGFKPGVYCISTLASGLFATVPQGAIWVANYSKFAKKTFKPPYPHPAPSLGGFKASLWQLIGNTTIEFEDIGGGKKHLVVDLDSSDSQDPSGIN
jgi:hypothetical protein